MTTEELLKNLIQTSLDCSRRYALAADRATHQSFQNFFRQQCEFRLHAARQLEDKVREMGGQVEESGTVAGKLGTAAMEVSEILSGDTALVNWCLKEDRSVLNYYQLALADPLPESCRGLLERQLRIIEFAVSQLENLDVVYERAKM